MGMLLNMSDISHSSIVIGSCWDLSWRGVEVGGKSRLACRKVVGRSFIFGISNPW